MFHASQLALTNTNSGILDLHHNDLTGTLPDIFGSLTNMSEFSVRDSFQLLFISILHELFDFSYLKEN